MNREHEGPGPSERPVTLIAALVAGAVVALGIAATQGYDGTSLADEIDDAGRAQIQRELEESGIFELDPEDMPPPGGGERVAAPEPGTPDRHDEPVPCNIFSPDALADIGGQVQPSEGIPARHYHEHVSLRCLFDGVSVTTYTFEATASGEGTAAVWDAYEIELTGRHGIAGLGDGAGIDEDNCRLHVADSNLVVSMSGDGGDPRTCGDLLRSLAEDFLSELPSR